MPIECICEICQQTIWFVTWGQWLHYYTPEPWHDATPPVEINLMFAHPEMEN